MQRLKDKWGITSNGQLIVIFVVFGITGSASVWLAKPLLHFLNLDRLNAWVRIPLRIILIFPIYQVVLVCVGTLFGQRVFFWNFVKRMWMRRK